MTEITNKIYYVGVNDRYKHRFEGLWPLPNGVSYNSYIIDDEKVALVDTVEVDFFTQFLENIHEVIGDRDIDYLIINHMEPDHSGSIALIKKYYPNIKIVGNKKTLGMLEGFYGVTDDVVEVKNGETLSLGNHELSFVLIPMVHWPETMVTLDAKNKVLFSGDAFGCFGALNGGIIDTEINCETFWLEMVRYYSNIVGKYGIPVQNALKKLAGVELDYICSTHGPVWHEHIEKVIGMYDKMSKYETEPGLVICYGTMYGNTERMAEIIARAASKAGVNQFTVLIERVGLEVQPGRVDVGRSDLRTLRQGLLPDVGQQDTFAPVAHIHPVSRLYFHAPDIGPVPLLLRHTDRFSGAEPLRLGPVQEVLIAGAVCLHGVLIHRLVIAVLPVGEQLLLPFFHFIRHVFIPPREIGTNRPPIYFSAPCCFSSRI